MRKHIEFSEINFRKELERYKKSLSDNDDDTYNHQRNLQHNLETEFPQYHWKATILVVFSIFEDNLNRLCLIFEDDGKLKLRLKDISDKGINGAKVYLSKVVDIDFPSGGNWQQIKRVKAVRNILAHTSGYVDRKNKSHNEVYRIAESDKNLRIAKYSHFKNGRDEIFLKPDYILDFITTLESFYGELELAIKTKGFT